MLQWLPSVAGSPGADVDDRAHTADWRACFTVRADPQHARKPKEAEREVFGRHGGDLVAALTQLTGSLIFREHCR